MTKLLRGEKVIKQYREVFEFSTKLLTSCGKSEVYELSHFIEFPVKNNLLRLVYK